MPETASIRKDPPSGQPNNQDVFIWALYLLGGSENEVDVEDIYLKAFELAPARLSWRTRPELCDYKKTSKALQSVEATTHVGLVLKTHSLARKLTADGVLWVEQFKPLLEQTYLNSPVAAAATNIHEKRRKSIKETSTWSRYFQNQEFDFFELAEALECSTGSPKKIWISRIDALATAGLVLSDEKLQEFATQAKAYVEEKVNV